MAEEKINLSDDERARIEVFRDTYNALYIKDLSDEKKLYSVGNNPVLQKLVDNLNAPRTYAVDYIEGPISFTKFKIEKNGLPKKSFYIFGDYHRDTRGHCHDIENKLEFHEYIRELSKNSPSFFDVYVERSFRDYHYADAIVGSIANETSIPLETMFLMDPQDALNPQFEVYKTSKDELALREEKNDDELKIRPGESYVFIQLGKQFKKCLFSETRNEPECELMRIHDIDLRGFFDPNNISSEFYVKVILEILKSNKLDFERKMSILKNQLAPQFNLLLDTFLDKDQRNIAGKLLTIAKSNSKVEHELNQLDGTYINRNHIEEFIKTQYNIILSESSNSHSSITTLKNYLSGRHATVNSLKLALLKLIAPITKLNALTMDMYCLARIFKRYTPKGSIEAYQPTESKNIIIYAGVFHTQNYIKFLKFIGGEPIVVNEESSSISCIRTNTKLPYPNSRIL